MRKVYPLMQKEVVTELKNRGYADISERRIVDWRHKGLLPPFDEARRWPWQVTWRKL